MPRISTDNYDTVASWNGSQDLFVVEQPDGTKVATPAMVKQFIEAGDFVATGEVKDGHGNILKDMAKSADVDAEIGDLSQTGITGATVAAQIGAIGTAISTQIGKLKIAVISQTFTGVDVNIAWGSLYQSPADLSIDISSLNLQSTPKFFSVGIQTAWAAFLITLPTATNTAINFRPIRPTTATGISITATALVIYE